MNLTFIHFSVVKLSAKGGLSCQPQSHDNKSINNILNLDGVRVQISYKNIQQTESKTYELIRQSYIGKQL
ncbi:CLUMA_CG001182, isoform A [Clunio marinus]|uniref:CLUMA_CG001182, isoform A n=1 Tax=Clunio marinus TaxID=568069 RepID=A0A1J1HIZ9_9DIPT|nr:CLUMA_CG001182, isoform A [Clunio marinus]